MPSETSLEYQQYYQNPTNQFWKLLSEVLAHTIPHSYTDKVEFLHRNSISIWDVLASCERVGSSDSSITNAQVNDFQGFFDDHPTIKVCFFNGQKAEALFRKHVTCRHNIRFVTLPSSSSAHAVPFTRKVNAWMVVAEALK